MGRLRRAQIAAGALLVATCAKTPPVPAAAPPGPAPGPSAAAAVPVTERSDRTATEKAGITVELGAAFGTLRVVNHGPVVRLRSGISVEQAVGGGGDGHDHGGGERWTAVPVANLRLREGCAAPAPENAGADCFSLDAHSSIQVAPWTGKYCAAQCPSSCRLDSAAPAGRYRFVITSCDGHQTFASLPFDKPAAGKH